MTIAESHAKRKKIAQKRHNNTRMMAWQGNFSLWKNDDTAHIRINAIIAETINHY